MPPAPATGEQARRGVAGERDLGAGAEADARARPPSSETARKRTTWPTKERTSSASASAQPAACGRRGACSQTSGRSANAGARARRDRPPSPALATTSTTTWRAETPPSESASSAGDSTAVEMATAMRRILAATDRRHRRAALRVHRADNPPLTGRDRRDPPAVARPVEPCARRAATSTTTERPYGASWDSNRSL